MYRYSFLLELNDIHDTELFYTNADTIYAALAEVAKAYKDIEHDVVAFTRRPLSTHKVA